MGAVRSQVALRRLWLVCALSLTACGQVDEAASDDPEGAAVTDSTDAAADVVRVDDDRVLVETTPAAVGPISSTLPFSATLETEAAVSIYSRITGLVDRIAVEEGEQVVEGAPLLFIEDDELRIAAQEAQVGLDRLQAQFERTSKMHQRELVSEQDYETARFELERAKLALERAELNLRHVVVRAPFAGVITERAAQRGERIDQSRKLFDLVKLDEMIARVHVPAQNLGRIESGQQAVVVAELPDSMSFAGWVKRVSPVVDPGSGTFKVTVGVAADSWLLRPGLFVGVEIILDRREQAILVPKRAVVYDGGRRYLFTVRDSVATRVRLDAGYEDHHAIEARSGLAAGDQVVVLGHNGLKDGTRVRTAMLEAATATADSAGR